MLFMLSNINLGLSFAHIWCACWQNRLITFVNVDNFPSNPAKRPTCKIWLYNFVNKRIAKKRRKRLFFTILSLWRSVDHLTDLRAILAKMSLPHLPCQSLFYASVGPIFDEKYFCSDFGSENRLFWLILHLWYLTSAYRTILTTSLKSVLRSILCPGETLLSWWSAPVRQVLPLRRPFSAK